MDTMPIRVACLFLGAFLLMCSYLIIGGALVSIWGFLYYQDWRKNGNS